MSAHDETAARDPQEAGEEQKTMEAHAPSETQETHDTEQRPASNNGSEKDTETFEDALETGSVRSLTKRQRPINRLSDGEHTNSDYNDEASRPAAVANGHQDLPEQAATTGAKPPRPLSQVSSGSLDNVNL
ncbi:uncharacterized protein THITE_2171608, partial [Thermothielavioides terrestris NRRL 8126]